MRKKIAKTQTDDELWTPRKLRHMMALGGTGAVPVGMPGTVADGVEKWMNAAGIDGFNVQRLYSIVLLKRVSLILVWGVTSPTSYEDIVQLLAPEMYRRGVYWTLPPSYTTSTSPSNPVASSNSKTTELHQGNIKQDYIRRILISCIRAAETLVS